MVAWVLLVTVVLLGALGGQARANDVSVRDLTQEQFRELSTEVGLAITPYQLRPAEGLGFPGFDLGAEVTAVEINRSRSYWQEAVDDPDDLPSFLPVPKLHANVGLPLGIDLGGYYGAVPGSNVRLYGGDVKWAVIRGGVVWPALAVRGAYTKLDGVDDLDLDTKSLDASLSKGFGPLTPYVGAGRVWMEAEPRGAAAGVLERETEQEDRVFVGLRLRALLVSAVAEASFAKVPAYTLRLNVSF
ncbi:MAG TPA: hypothetical protein VIM86_10495 [Thermodesulfobacteriota bacterium]